MKIFNEDDIDILLGSILSLRHVASNKCYDLSIYLKDASSIERVCHIELEDKVKNLLDR